MRYKKINNPDGSSVLTVFAGGDIHMAHSGAHPNFDKILAELESGNDDDVYIVGLIDIENAVRERFASVTERVSVSIGKVYFDGSLLDNQFAKHMDRLLTAGRYDDLVILAKFWEKVADNPKKRIREELLSWIAHQDLSITPEGDIIGYKSVEPGTFLSWHRGPGIVNGVQVPLVTNKPGDVVSMNRENIDTTDYKDCGVGLHVGTWKYAQNFHNGQCIVAVFVNPQHVVNVPRNESTKMRVEQYTIGPVVTKPYDEAIVG